MTHKLFKIIQPTKEQFLALLAKLDSCIEYMSKNSQFKDSAQFLIKFNNCLTQVLGQIKTHVMRTLESSTNNLLGKIMLKSLKFFNIVFSKTTDESENV